MENPELGPRRLVYENKIQKVFKVEASFGLFNKEYFVTDYGSRTGIVLVNNGAVLLVRQYRLLIDGLSWEVPGGKVEADEKPVKAATRECREETGIVCRDLKPLLSFLAGNDVLDNPSHLFYCEDFVTGDVAPHVEGEVIDRAWVPLEDCLEKIFNREIRDSFSIVALLAYHTLLSRNKS